MSKVPTAFDLLKLAGRKRLRPSQNAEKEVDAPRKKQAKGSSFQPCPVCSKAIASALLGFHISSCLEASSKGSKGVQGTAQQQLHQEQHAQTAEMADGMERPDSLARPASRASDGHAAEVLDTEASKEEQPASHLGSVRNGEKDSGNHLYGTQDLLSKGVQVGASLSQAASTAAKHPAKPEELHQVGCTSGVRQPTRQGRLPNPDEDAHKQQDSTQHASQHVQAQPEAKEQHALSESHRPHTGLQQASQQKQAKLEEAQPKAAQRSVAPSGNAFAHMMQKQKERAQSWTFYLGRAEDGRLFWHMWRDVKGSAPVPEIITHLSGHKVNVKALDQTTIQRCKERVVWSAESQASLADLECRVDESVDRAAAGKVTLRLCTNIEPRHGGRLDVGSLLWKSGTAGRPWEYTGTASLLKSALQKNIRRGRAEEAVRCAQRLLQSEPGELLRRACVISVEDALLHPRLPLLAFLMGATAKGYALGRTLASACLQIVHDLAVVPVQDRAPKGQDYCSSPEGALPQLVLDEARASLIRSMLMRAAYGGLAGDVAMLRRFSQLWLASMLKDTAVFDVVGWLQRLIGVADPEPGILPKGSQSADEASNSWAICLEASFADVRPPGTMVEWGSLGRLKPDDIPAAAVDFHISSIVDDLLGKPNILAVAAAAAAKTGSDPAGVIQRAMWHFSGSCNHRSPLQGCFNDKEGNVRDKVETLKPVWESVQPAAEAWAHQYISSRFRPA